MAATIVNDLPKVIQALSPTFGRYRSFHPDLPKVIFISTNSDLSSLKFHILTHRNLSKEEQVKKAAAFCAIVVALHAFIPSLNAQTLPLEQRIFILSKTYASLPLQFAHWRDASFKPVQLDSIYRVFLKRGIEADSRKDFGLLMHEFIALLNNSHSWYHDRTIFGSMLPMGFSWTHLDGGWVVTLSSIEGLQKGDLILKIDGKGIDEWYKELSKYFGGSNERARKSRLYSILAVTLPEQYSLQYQTRDRRVKEATISRATLKPTNYPLKTEGRWLVKDRLAYIKIPSFNSPEFQNDALELLRQFKNAPTLIVDVRGNSGGSTPEKLTAALMNKPYRWWAESTPLTFGLFRYYSEARPNIELNEYFRYAQLQWRGEENLPDTGAYSGKLIILTDGKTGSAAEDFTVPFKDNGRALIIGETTNGSTGQPYMFGFGDGISIGIGTKRAYMPNGAEFEGIGIEPDIRVQPVREDFYTERDRVLERAIAEAERLRPQ